MAVWSEQKARGVEALEVDASGTAFFAGAAGTGSAAALKLDAVQSLSVSR